MIVAIHQPNYFPWLGYFYKIATADVFVFLDDAQFTKNGYQNRTKIKSPNGPTWLTQPVQHSGHAFQSTKDVVFDLRTDWRQKHIKSLVANYSRSAHGKNILGQCETWLKEDSRDLVSTNIKLITSVATILGLRAKFVLSSTLGIETNKSERIVDICRSLGATRYLSGGGAKAYQTEAEFQEHGIELTYSDFRELPHPQLWGDFTGGLSVLDALCNIGAEATQDILVRR